MITTCLAPRRHLFLRTARIIQARGLKTLESNTYINILPHPGQPSTQLLTLLPTDPPTPDLAIGSSTTIPPTPDTFQTNSHFLEILHATINEHATRDPVVISQAKAFASTAGSSLGSGGAFFPQPPSQSASQTMRQKRARERGATGGGGGAGGGGAGGASAQGGMGGGGTGGFVHVSDQRNPPDWGRVAWSEDIFGSLEVDSSGEFVGERGGYQRSGTYRVVTREGVLGLSPFLREKLVEALKNVEKGLRK